TSLAAQRAAGAALRVAAMAGATAPQHGAAPPLPRRGGGHRERLASAVRSESTLFRLGVAVIAVHVLDDNIVQPQPGTSAADHLVSGLVPLAVLALAAWSYPRLRGGRRGAMALTLGALGIFAGVEAVQYTGTVGAS